MALFTAIGAAIAGAGTFLAGVISSALYTVASIGLSYAARALAGKPKNPDTPVNHFSVQGQLQAGGNVPRSFNFGYSATAGQLVWGNFWGNSGDTPNAYLTQVIKLADLPGGSLLEVWISGELCTLGPVAHADYGYPVTQYNKDGKDHLWVKYYDGTQTTADAFLVTKAASVDRPYEATRVGVGCAYVICTALVNDTLYTGIPTYKFAVSGVPLYDPTKDSTNGGTGSHRWSDWSTWGGDGDDLPAVQAYNVMRGIYFDGAWLYGLQGMTAARLPTVNWNVQIEKCRAEIEGASGAEPTYRSGGQINVSAQIGNTLETILTTCQGKISEIGGFYKIHLGAPDSPSFAFTDDDILSTEGQNFAPFFTLSDSINGITASYPDPAQGWNVAVAPPYKVPAMVTRDGGRELFADPAFDFVPYPEQVQRLQKSAVEEAARERRHTITLWSKFWFIEPGDIGEWDSVRNGYEAKLFRADGVVDKANLDVMLNITEVDPTDYDWDTGEYNPIPTGSTTIPRPAPQGIVDWFAEGATLYDTSGIARRPAIRLTWDGDMPGVAGVQYEVRLAVNETPVTRGRTDQLAAGAILISQSLLPDTEYETRGQYIPTTPRDMLWSDWLSVTTPDVRLSLLDFGDDLRDAVTANLSEGEKLDKIVQIIGATVVQALGTISANKQILKEIIEVREGVLGASIEQVRTVAVTASEAVAELSTTTEATFEEQSSSIAEVATAVATLNGNLAAQYSVTLDVNGYASGFRAVNDGTLAGFTISADVFELAFPDVTGGEVVRPFQIANVNGLARISFKGDMFADGSVKVQALDVAELTAITANLGDAEVTGKLTGGPSGNLELDFTLGTIKGYGE